MSKFQSVVEKIKELVTIVKDFAMKMWKTQKAITIAVISVVVLSTVLLVALAGGGDKKADNGSVNDNAAGDTPKTAGRAFLEACIYPD